MANETLYPQELTSQLKPDDSIVKFLSLGGSGKKSRGFIAITEQRLIFKQTSREKKSSSDSVLNVPLSKVSSIAVGHETTGGCLSKEHVYTLQVNVQGLPYNLYLVNEKGAIEAANEFVRTFLERSE